MVVDSSLHLTPAGSHWTDQIGRRSPLKLLLVVLVRGTLAQILIASEKTLLQLSTCRKC